MLGVRPDYLLRELAVSVEWFAFRKHCSLSKNRQDRIKAALKKGHKIPRVFLYHDGVNNSTRLTEPPQDDRNVVQRWQKLAADHKLDLVVCVAAALRRGIKEENLAERFRISGLGQLVESGIQADRLVTFGD